MDYKNIIIYLFDRCIPKYGTPESACMDLYAAYCYTINPGEIAYISLGVRSELDPRFHAKIYERSSTHKRGISLVNKIGIIDSDYRGEWIAGFKNITESPVTVNDGDKICQAEICLNGQTPFIFSSENHTLSETERGEGGFGSTGN